MLYLFFGLVVCLAGSVFTDEGVNWVILVAGSNEYYNYRHQVYSCLHCLPKGMQPLIRTINKIKG